MSGIICTAIGSPATAALLPSGGKDRAWPGLATRMTTWLNQRAGGGAEHFP